MFPHVENLIFVGLNGYALALDRKTGEIAWSNNEMHSGYVTLLLDGDRLIVSTNGYIYCLDPLTGRTLWHNPLKGYGQGAPTALVSVRGQGAPNLPAHAHAQSTSRSRGSVGSIRSIALTPLHRLEPNGPDVRRFSRCTRRP
jgi:outer membrane protein assembly factor BamB